MNFEGRRFVCWKCGSPDHIGDKCRYQERTFEEVFGDDREEDSPHSWAAVVKGNSGLGEDIRAKRDLMAKQIKDRNDIKAKEKMEAEEKRRAELEEVDTRKKGEELARQEALVCGRNSGKNFAEIEDGLGDSLDDVLANSTSGKNVIETEEIGLQLPPLPQRGGQRNRVWVDGLGTSQGGVDDDPGGGRQGVEGLGTSQGVVDDDPGGRLGQDSLGSSQGGVDDGPDPGEGQGVDGLGTSQRGVDDDPGPGGGKGLATEGSMRGEGVLDGVTGTLVIDRIDPCLLTNRDQQLLPPGLPVLGERSFTLDTSLERVFGLGATRLAIEFEGTEDDVAQHDMSGSSSDEEINVVDFSTPERENQSKKRLRDDGNGGFGDLSSIETGGDVASGDESDEDLLGDSKKQKLGGSDLENSGEETVIDDDGEGSMDQEQSDEGPVPIRVTQGWLVPTVPCDVQEQVPDSVNQESPGDSC